MKKFTISIPQEKLEALQVRLETTHFPESPEHTSWSYGTDLDYMKELTRYWKNEFNWRKAEKMLNQFNHFTTDVNGITIHFIHQKSKNPDATPLVLLHGWPDSFFRFYKVISELSNEFDVIVPSLPGFGFSEKVAMNSGETATIIAELMKQLDYDEFTVGGGDISTPIIQTLATTYKKSINAVYLTDVGYPTGSEDFSTMTTDEQQFAGKCQQWWYQEAAYNMIQSTKPQTLAFALSDSPVGLAAWMVEKFQAWSDDGIEKAFTKDEILTNICIYYFTDTIASSLRTYAENTRAMYATGMPKPTPKIEVATVIASYPGEAVPVIEDWANRNAHVVRFKTMPKGGHFAPLEVPQLFAQDLGQSVLAILK